jgi:hypothetical protein
MKQPSSNQTDLPKLSAPAHRALASIGVTNLKDLTKFTEAEIKKLHGMGPSGIRELHEALAQQGLAFAPKK